MESRRRKEPSDDDGDELITSSSDDRRTRCKVEEMTEEDQDMIKKDGLSIISQSMAPLVGTTDDAADAADAADSTLPTQQHDALYFNPEEAVAAAAAATATVEGDLNAAVAINNSNTPIIATTTEENMDLDIVAASSLDVDAPAAALKQVPSKPSTPEELAHWNRMFFELMLYRIKNGNVNVKSTEEEHRELYQFIVQLRKDYKIREKDPSESTLTEEQIVVLESIRFAFTTRGEEHWQKNYEKLKEYKTDHGHVLVPRQCEIPGLGDWVTSQRQQYQEYTKGKPTPLTKQRKELLDEIGFQFRIRNRPEWGAKYDELLLYKEKHGDTRVPQHHTPNKALGKWVAKQREQFKLHNKGKHSFLTPDRLEKLNNIGFVWSIRDQPLFKKASSEKLDDSIDIVPVDVAVAKHEVVDCASNEVHVEEEPREEGMLVKVDDDEVAAAATAAATAVANEEETMTEHVSV